MRRVVVYGSSGGGKSTFASELARRCGATHVEIDLLAYDTDGIHVAQEVLRERFEESLQSDRWVVEGMHRDQLYRALKDADTLVWLNYSKYVVARRLSARVLRQLILRHERHGRRTTIRSTWERELPFVWKTMRSYERRRSHGKALAEKATTLGVRVEPMASPAGARRLLDRLPPRRSVA